MAAIFEAMFKTQEEAFLSYSERKAQPSILDTIKSELEYFEVLNGFKHDNNTCQLISIIYIKNQLANKCQFSNAVFDPKIGLFNPVLRWLPTVNRNF